MANCDCCNTVGIFDLNQSQLAGPPLPQRQRKVYNLGNGNTTPDENVAKKALLVRDYKEIADFETIQQSDYIPGMIGTKFLPSVWVTKIPKVAQPLDYDQQYQANPSQIEAKQHVKNLAAILEQSGEKSVFEGLESYFDKYKNEDAFVIFNQDIPDKTVLKPTWHEIDALVINCTKGYILVIEAKGKLHKIALNTALKQLTTTKSIIEKNFLTDINENWKIINAIYTSEIDTSLNICQSCQHFVISSIKGDFVQQMESILNQVAIKNWRYAKDFYTLVKEILPLRVRIAKGLSDAFMMNSTIMNKIQTNLEDAGSATMVAFWSKSQFNVVMDWFNCKRLLFESGFSTGKTISMIYCMHKLLEIGEKVLFVIYVVQSKEQWYKNWPSLLKIKIQHHFDQLQQGGLFSDPQQFQVVEVDLHTQKAFDDLCHKYHDFHFFVDEVNFIHKGLVSSIRETVGIKSYGVDVDLLKYWSQKIPPHLHLWVAICYSKNGFDSSSLDAYYPTRPEMNLPMRNVKDTVEYVKSKINVKSRYGIVQVGTANSLNDTSKFDEIDTLKIPTNLTRSFKPVIIQAKNYTDGFKKVFQALSDGNYFESALFVLPRNIFGSSIFGGSENSNCKCYKEDLQLGFDFTLQIMDYIDRIYQQIQRSQPVFYLCQSNFTQAFNWVSSGTKTNDMITNSFLVNGYEHSIVVIFNRNGRFEHNLAMRSTGLLVIVNLPFTPWIHICFSESPGWSHFKFGSNIGSLMP